MSDQGQWTVAPFYDVTFSPGAHGEHMTAYCGFGKEPPLKTIQKLAALANVTWPQARQVIEKILESLSQWQALAAQLGISKATTKQLSQQLSKTYQHNKRLLGK